MKKNVLFRVDGSSKLGWGHIFRCLGLAETFRKHKIYSHFFIKDYDDEVIKFIEQSRLPVSSINSYTSYKQEINLLLGLIQKLQCEMLVVDLNNPLVLTDVKEFENYLNEIKRSGVNILLFDGFGDDCISVRVRLPVDTLVIPYVGAETREFKLMPYTLVLRGTKYFVVRNDLKKYARKHKNIKKQVKTILVALGKGWDTEITGKIISSLALSKFQLKIIVFTDLQDSSSIKQMIEQSKLTHIEFIQDSNKFLKCMYACDILITGSGLTKYETAAIGVPTISFSQTLDQEKMTYTFAQKKTLVYGGRPKYLSQSDIIQKVKNVADDYKLRQWMSKNGQKLIDTNGGERILTLLKQKNYL